MPKRRKMSKRNSAELIGGLHKGFTVFPQGCSSDKSHLGGLCVIPQRAKTGISSADSRKIIGQRELVSGFTKLRIPKSTVAVVNGAHAISTACDAPVSVEKAILWDERSARLEF